MSYRCILVNLDIDGPIVSIVNLAVGLAKRVEARLIGFCAADVPFPTMGMAPEGAAIAVDVWQEQRNEIEGRFKELRAEFEKLATASVELGWRDMIGNPTRSLAQAARLADLVITGAQRGASTGDGYRVANPGSVVLQAGRPVLVAADGVEHLLAKKINVAWKDTREARRAVVDAVPLLQSANEVIVVTVNSDPDDSIRESVEDVAAFLAAHGIKARAEVLKDRNESEKLAEFIASADADLVVSGAYGHSRVREWVLGGVTRSLLDETGLDRFMSS